MSHCFVSPFKRTKNTDEATNGGGLAASLMNLLSEEDKEKKEREKKKQEEEEKKKQEEEEEEKRKHETNSHGGGVEPCAPDVKPKDFPFLSISSKENSTTYTEDVSIDLEDENPLIMKYYKVDLDEKSVPNLQSAIQIFTEANYEELPRCNLRCPFPRIRSTTEPEMFTLKQEYGFVAEQGSNQLAGRVIIQNNCYSDSQMKNLQGCLTFTQPGFRPGTHLLLKNGDNFDQTDFGKNVADIKGQSSHAILLQSYVESCNTNTTGSMIEVLSAFPQENPKDGSVLVDVGWCNRASKGSKERLHYAVVPNKETRDEKIGLYDVRDVVGCAKDASACNDACSPEAYRWRQLCMQDFEDAIEHKLKLNDSDVLRYAVKRDNNEIMVPTKEIATEDPKINLLQFLVFSYAHDIRQVHVDKHGDESIKRLEPESTIDFKPIYVKIDVVLEVAQQYIDRFQNTNTVNLRDSFLFVRPAGVEATWANRNINDRAVELNLTVHHRILFVPSFHGLKEKEKFEKGLSFIDKTAEMCKELAENRKVLEAASANQ